MNKSESKYFNTALLMDQALLALLDKKDYEFITIKEICQKAGVNRSTFYLHYENMDDLLVETIEMINKKFHSTFGNKKLNPADLDKKDLFLIEDEYIVPYLNLIKQHKKIYKLIHNKPHIFNSQGAFQKLYSELFQVILEKYGVADKKDREYIFAFFSFGAVAIIQKWVSHDCQEDIGYVCNMIKRCIGHRNED
ncbi:MAG: TetR/AcrR family transcriptional regulator [Clostridia bacterium]|nr:TetR/AcrR family transcriptional regulator [Clostridia bacterium]